MECSASEALLLARWIRYEEEEVRSGAIQHRKGRAAAAPPGENGNAAPLRRLTRANFGVPPAALEGRDCSVATCVLFPMLG